jgi:hypothetical protein
MTTPSDLDSFTAGALAGLGPHDLPQREAEALRARCHAAVAARRRRGGARAAAWQTLYDRVLEPAAVVLLGGAVLLTTVLRAVAILTGRVA